METQIKNVKEATELLNKIDIKKNFELVKELQDLVNRKEEINAKLFR